MSRTSTMRYVRLLPAAAALAAAACAAGPAPAPPTSAAEPSATADNTTACDALVAFDAAAVTYPGADPTAPPASPDQLKQWAGTAIGPIGDLAGSVPGELTEPVATLRGVVEKAQQGSPTDPSDPKVNGATAAVDSWGHDNCNYPAMDVTVTGTEIRGVPPTLSRGPVALSLTNVGPADRHGFVLLVARVRDGATYTLGGIRDGTESFDSVADVVGVAQPTEQSPVGYGMTSLTPGRYLVVSPVGSPPDFRAVLAEELKVT
jgi:hypothetical protein